MRSRDSKSKRRFLTWLKHQRVGVICGGWSAERKISLLTGAAVEKALREKLRVPVVKIDATPQLPNQVIKAKITSAFIALHGPFGEDGGVQGLLEGMKIPYTGSGVRASAWAMHKPTTKRILDLHKIPTPRWTILEKSKNSSTPRVSFPIVVKPEAQGSAVGVRIARNHQQLRNALQQVWTYGSRALLEEYVPGREVTVAVLGRETLPIIEIVPQHQFYDYHSKYAPGGSQHIVPARLKEETSQRIRKEALRTFQALGAEVFGRVDMIVMSNGCPLVLEVNTVPGLTRKSLFPDAARASGLSFEELILEILRLSIG